MRLVLALIFVLFLVEWAFATKVTLTHSGGNSSGTIGGTTGTTDNAVIRADGTGGATVQGSGCTLDDSGNLSCTSFKIANSGFQWDNSQMTTGSDFSWRMLFQSGAASALEIVGNNTSQAFRSMFEIQSNKASNIGMIIQPFADMSADNFQVKDSNGNLLSALNKIGDYYQTGVAGTSLPTATNESQILYNTTDHQWCFWNGSAWKRIGDGSTACH